MTDQSTIRVCEHHPERETPLLWTFAFPGAEFWCPHCGYRHGMFGAGKIVDSTPELMKRREDDERASSAYLEAMGSRSCSSMLYEGVRYDRDKLPLAAREKFEAVISAWKYQAAPGG